MWVMTDCSGPVRQGDQGRESALCYCYRECFRGIIAGYRYHRITLPATTTATTAAAISQRVVIISVLTMHDGGQCEGYAESHRVHLDGVWGPQ